MTSSCFIITQYTKHVSVKTQLYVDNRFCVSNSDTFHLHIAHFQAHANPQHGLLADTYFVYYILILFSYLCIGLKNRLLASVFPTKCVTHAQSTSSSFISQPNA
jgi:hypothetical protein